ncbi:acidic tetraheme cytochrome c3 TmcA [Thermodesulfobacteriota bacterium]
MKKRTLMAALFIIVSVLVLAVITASSQENVKSVQDSAFKQLMRPTVPFIHDEHNENAEIAECGTCHHVFKDGKRVPDETSEDRECSDCHNPANEAYSKLLVKAYHIHCKRCHLEKKKGPIMCADCHVK